MENNNGTQQKKSAKKWPVWTGGALAVALISGSIGAAIGSEDSSDSADSVSHVTESPVTAQTEPQDSTTTDNTENAGSETTGGDDDTAGGTESTTNGAALAGMSTADEAAAYIDTATGAVSGTPTGIELNQDGSWDVEIMESANSEVTVRVYEDGTTQIVETDQEDDAASLTQEDIARIFDAALADTNGTIVSISAEDENDEDRDAYGVEVLSSDGTQVVELELDINYSVIDREVEGVEDFLD